MAVKGVDISEMNGSVDFSSLKNAGVKFVIIRCGFGSDYTYQDDKRFSENVKKAESFQIPWGVYLYSYATNTSMAKSEANHVLRLLGGKKPLYGVWYDVEDSSQANSDLVSICETFCNTIESSGLYCGIYSMLSWMNGKLNNSRLDKYDKWVAQWSNACSYSKPYGMWQYTDRWSIGGKSFDGNYAYKDYPSIIGNTSEEKEEDDMTEAETIKLINDQLDKYFKNLESKPASGWAKEAINYVNNKGIMVGDPDGNFRPQDHVTREELAQVIFNQTKNANE